MPYRGRQLKSKIHKIKPKNSILRNKWFWVFAMSLLLIISGIGFILFYPSFQVKNIEILGNSKINLIDIQKTVDNSITIPILSLGSFKVSSKSIFLVDTEKINKDILNRFSEIEKSETKNNLLKGIKVNVLERKPIGRYCQNSSDNCFLIDSNGVVFESTSSSSGGTTVIRQNIESDANLSIGKQAIRHNIMVFIYKTQEVLKNNFQIELNEALITSPIRLNIITNKNWKIYFDISDSSNVEDQINKLSALLGGEIPQKSLKNLKYIDLRPKDRAIICDNDICGK